MFSVRHKNNLLFNLLTKLFGHQDNIRTSLHKILKQVTCSAHYFHVVWDLIDANVKNMLQT